MDGSGEPDSSCCRWQSGCPIQSSRRGWSRELCRIARGEALGVGGVSDRDAILEALPEPLGGRLAEPFDRKRRPPEDLWLQFEERLAALGGQMLPREALSLLLNRGGSLWPDEEAVEFLPEPLRLAKTVWDAEFGICVADLAIAETGSLIIAAAQGRSRLSSL